MLKHYLPLGRIYATSVNIINAFLDLNQINLVSIREGQFFEEMVLPHFKVSDIFIFYFKVRDISHN